MRLAREVLTPFCEGALSLQVRSRFCLSFRLATAGRVCRQAGLQVTMQFAPPGCTAQNEVLAPFSKGRFFLHMHRCAPHIHA